jgi:hypothetical protein
MPAAPPNSILRLDGPFLTGQPPELCAHRRSRHSVVGAQSRDWQHRHQAGREVEIGKNPGRERVKAANNVLTGKQVLQCSCSA